MSKEVEQRVVEMRFDNKQFESATATSMSTLDKLKQKLNFDGAAKGFDNISSAAKKVDMTSLGYAVETVRSRFSALEVVGITALANITNSAVNAGKRMISALTIDPVKTGFQEYETQINAVQTILANTQSKGSTLEDVNKALDELNKYADMTIYNFTEMTRNIGTFTAAGVDLDKSVTSIKGIANLAAVSGSTSQQASTAMYQLSQALAAGKVQLMDWNSVVNAGMGGELFQNALKRTATQMGTNVDALIKKYGSFRESLTKGNWLTAEVLTETLTQLSGAYSEADLIAQGYSEKQAKEIAELAQTAVDAATKVKTFTQLWDTLKEAAQSGWTQSWEIIIGDFEEAKELLTGISDFVGNIINESSNKRNELLEGALGGSASKWETLTAKINECGISTEQFEARLKETITSNVAMAGSVDDLIAKHGSLAAAFKAGAIPVSLITKTIKSFAKNLDSATKPVQVATDQLEYFNKVVGQVVRGDFGNGEERIKKLTAAGYDNVAVQKLVNHVWERNGKTWDNVTLTSEELTKVIGSLSSEELQNVGYTKEQADALKELAAQAEKTGTPINELIESFNRPSGRELLIDSFKNVLGSLYKAIMAVHDAWEEIFPPMTSDQLYGFIEGFNKLTTVLMVDDDTAGKITRTFKGLFAILDLITTIVGGAFKLGFEVLKTVLGAFNMDILDLTAMIGDAIVKFHDFVLENEYVTKGIEFLAKSVANAIVAFKEWFDAFIQLPAVQAAIESFKNGLLTLKDIGLYAIEGLKNGFQNGISSIPQMLMDLGNLILTTIKNVLGIHSPSTKFEEIGWFSIEGLKNGFLSGLDALLSVLGEVANRLMELFGQIPWGKVVAAGISIGLVATVKQIIDVVDALTAPLEGLGDLLSGAGDALEGFGKMLSGKAFELKTQGIRNIAVSIAILAGSLVVLTLVDQTKLLGAIGAIAALAAVIGVLSIAIGKFGPDQALKFSGFALAMVGVAASLLIVAAAVKKLETLDPNKAEQTMGAFTIIVLGLINVIAVYGKLVDEKTSANISKLGTMMLKLSVALLLMVAAIKIISGMNLGELTKGGLVVAAFVGIIYAISLFSSTMGPNVDKIGSMMTKLSASLILMVVAIKLISGLSVGELIKGGVAIAAFVGIIALLTKIVSSAGPIETKLGTTLLSISASMLILSGVVMILGGMDLASIIKGEAAILGLTGIMALLVNIVKSAGTAAPKIAVTLLAMSASIAILAGVSALMSLIDLPSLAKGIAAVGILTLFTTGLVKATANAQDMMGSLIAMSVAIGVMAAAVAALSFIDPLSLAGATAALSVLMGMFSLIIKSTKDVNASLGPLIVMTTAIGILGGVIYALSLLPVTSVLSTAVSLSALLLALSAAFKIVSTAGKIDAKTLIALGIMELAVVGLGVILGVLGYFNVQPSIETAIALSTLLLAMSAACVILAGVGTTGTMALSGAAILDAVILVVGGLIVGIGALVSYFPMLEEFMDKGITMLAKIGEGLGLFLGSIVGGFIEGAMSGLPSIGTALSDFSENAKPFFENVKDLDADALNGVKALAETVLILTGSDILNSLTSWFTGGNALDKFAEQLIPFGESIAQFSEVVSGRIDSEAVIAAANAGKALAEIANNIPKQGGVLQDFLGTQDIGVFGDQLKKFGSAMTEFSSTVAGKINSEAVIAAANGGKALSDLANNIPKQGGVLQDFLGTQDLSQFGTQLETFGASIVKFSQTVAPGGSSLINAEAVEASVNAGKSLAALAENIPDTGGIFAGILGKQSMSEFGADLEAFGSSLGNYYNSIKTIDNSIVDSTTNAANALITLADAIPDYGLFSGNTTLDSFGSQLEKFGTYFGNYYDSIKGVDTLKLIGVINQIKELVNLASAVSDINMSGLNGFSAALTKMAKDGITGVITAFDNAVPRFQQAANGMIAAFTDQISGASTKLRDSFIVILDFSLAAIILKGTAFKDRGTDLVDKLSDGVMKKSSDVINDFQKIMADSITKIRGNHTQFNEAGKYLVDGFAKGIQTNSYKAINEANNLAKKVTRTVETALDINSPSAVFETIGSYVVQGLANGILDNMAEVQSASIGLGAIILGSFRNALKINSPSVVMEEMGHYVVQGLAEGIKEDTSAEEAAAKKAQNIVSAFQSIFDDVDFSETTRNLDRELFDALNSGKLTESEEMELQAYRQNQDIETQKKRVQTAYAQYLATSQMFGENDKRTIEAHNAYKQEAIELVNFVNDLNDTVKEVDSLNEEWKAAEAEAYKTLNNWLMQNAQAYLDIGTSMEKIEEIGKKFTGYDKFESGPEFVLDYKILDAGAVLEETISGIVVDVKDAIETAIPETVENATNAGVAVATGLETGIESKSDDIQTASTELVSGSTEQLKAKRPQWYEAGVYLIDGFVEGIRSGIDKVKEAVEEVTSAATKILDDFGFGEKIQVESSSAALSSLQTIIGKDTTEYNPTISPVLELEDITIDSSDIDWTKTISDTLKPSYSKSQADKIESTINDSADESNANETTTPSKSVTQFVQNNYSPKALPRVEIYRQTKNQLATYERMVKK